MLKIAQSPRKLLPRFFKLNFQLSHLNLDILIVIQNVGIVLSFSPHSLGEILDSSLVLLLHLLVVVEHLLEVLLDLVELRLGSDAAFVVPPQLVLHLGDVRYFLPELFVVLLQLANYSLLVLDVAFFCAQVLILVSQVTFSLIYGNICVLKLCFQALDVHLVGLD